MRPISPAPNPALIRQNIPVPLRCGDKRKLLIVEASISVLATEGLQGFTFDAIGKRCAIGKSHVAYHFSSLPDLLRTSVAHAYTVGQKTVSDYIQREPDPGKQLQAYIYGTFHWIEIHPEHACTAALLGYLATLDATYRKTQTEIKEVGLQRIKALLKASGAKGPLPGLADSIQSLLMGKLLYFSVTKDKRFVRRVRSETWQAIQRLLP